MEGPVKNRHAQSVNYGCTVQFRPYASRYFQDIYRYGQCSNLQRCKTHQKEGPGKPPPVNFPVQSVSAFPYPHRFQSPGQLFVIDLPLSHFLLEEMPGSFFPRCPHHRFRPFFKIPCAFHSPCLSPIRAYIGQISTQIGHIRPIRDSIARFALYDRIQKSLSHSYAVKPSTR